MAAPALPDGIRIGHATDLEAGTGCTVVLAPEGSVASGEVRGGGPGTREGDVLSPASRPQGVQAILFTGGSAFGLAAADGVVRWHEERGLGHWTPRGLVPLVPAAVVFDLRLGGRRPGPDDGYAACEAAGAAPARGTVGAGTGCAVGKWLAEEGWTKGGVGLASERVAGVTVAALAVVNAFGDVLAEDGSVLAGVWTGSGYRPTVDFLREGGVPRVAEREATTLVCVMTDAQLTKTEAWHVARAASAGVARAVEPSATPVDGDAAYCIATGRVPVEGFVPLAIGALAASAVAAAVRDGVRSARGLPGCPAVSER